MPICPRCNTPIHAGAETQCPACGYSMLRANAVFGEHGVLFTRILDEAGVLTHAERQELMRALEDMERSIPPIALGIYITNDGRAQELRSHAHWVLNHAVIHHPSFGRREKVRAIEDAELRERMPGEKAEHPIGTRTSRWQRIHTWLRDVLHPLPPPVRQEWMLILVLDVQLELACFTWGYMLDPYINPDSINSCIIGARLKFRERDMVSGMRRVMKAAVSRIAVQSHATNRRLKRGGSVLPLLMGGALALSGTEAQAQQATNNTQWADEEVAEAVDDESTPAPTPPAETPTPPAEAPTPAPAQPSPAPQTPPASATDAAPRWSEQDYRHLLSGEMSDGYSMLQATHGKAPAKDSSAPRQQRNRTQESDTKIPKIYHPAYGVAGEGGVTDPQRLLSGVERADVEHTLRELNAHSPYRLYIGIYRAGQELPMELSVGTLVRSVAQPGEYAVLLLYGMGDTPTLELSYHEMKIADEERLAWLEKVRHAAGVTGGVEGLMAAARELHRCLKPVVADLPPPEQHSAVHVPLIPLEMREDQEQKEPSFKDKLKEAFTSPVLQNIAQGVGITLAIVALLAMGIWLRRRSGKLTQSKPDTRLSSPFGAGVSRAVRYLEGKEKR